ncbi:MAG: hypothetical protein QXD13_02550 [Candidatus Pacearchaeota archaeon]
MEVVVKTKFNAQKQRIEKVLGNKYIMYLAFSEDAGTISTIIAMLSKHFGVPTSNIQFKGFTATKDRLFELL